MNLFVNGAYAIFFILMTVASHPALATEALPKPCPYSDDLKEIFQNDKRSIREVIANLIRNSETGLCPHSSLALSGENMQTRFKDVDSKIRARAFYYYIKDRVMVDPTRNQNGEKLADLLALVEAWKKYYVDHHTTQALKQMRMLGEKKLASAYLLLGDVTGDISAYKKAVLGGSKIAAFQLLQLAQSNKDIDAELFWAFVCNNPGNESSDLLKATIAKYKKERNTAALTRIKLEAENWLGNATLSEEQNSPENTEFVFPDSKGMYLPKAGRNFPR